MTTTMIIGKPAQRDSFFDSFLIPAESRIPSNARIIRWRQRTRRKGAETNKKDRRAFLFALSSRYVVLLGTTYSSLLSLACARTTGIYSRRLCTVLYHWTSLPTHKERRMGERSFRTADSKCHVPRVCSNDHAAYPVLGPLGRAATFPIEYAI